MSEKLHLDRAALQRLWREMLRMRRFEARCVELYQAQKIKGFLHLYDGQEAVAAGVMSALDARDAVVATYREHGQALARGLPMRELLAEMLGQVEGCCRGRGGSMHIFDRARRFFGGNAIVGAGLPLATGIALVDQRLRPGAVTACFFGEGAVAEGAFHESLNLAALWKLPLLFVCENNGYAMGVPLAVGESQPEIFRKAAAYRIEAEAVDGMDPVAVAAAARRAVDRLRAGQGPYLLECRTYRFRAHSMFDAQSYRSREEVEAWRERDPVERLRVWLQANHQISAAELAAIEAGVEAEVDQAQAWAESGRPEPLADLERFVLMDQVVQDEAVAAGGPAAAGTSGMDVPRPAESLSASAAKAAQSVPGPALSDSDSKTSYREACRQAIRDALRADPRVLLLGEDVARYGGCYAVSKGLLDEFGPDRIVDTPLAENAVVGAGIGAAVAGLRPIVEVMTCNFSLLALDPIVNGAATLAHMSGGQFAVPLVVRMATGGGRQLAAQHSHSFEGWFAHVPGLKVLAPATVEDARHMLAAALADPNPVLLFEHIMLYASEDWLDPSVTAVDIERARIRRSGGDVTIATYGWSLSKCLQAARQLAAEGVEAEVIDLRVLRPLDSGTVIESLRKTHRIVIVDEGWKSGSISAELAARIAETALYELDAPVRRICAREVPVPYAEHLEAASLPQVADIVDAVRALVHPAGQG
ncbi:MAG: pyruvate dehydrogenase (acetyl-transferring) E1 component subunit alpha [Burkholderiales bacterium]|nr:pyruvate dehydrogenase (acetyl-transferring) E1 component subunit alpha [Burkholderiales bacterium]